MPLAWPAAAKRPTKTQHWRPVGGGHDGHRLAHPPNRTVPDGQTRRIARCRSMTSVGATALPCPGVSCVSCLGVAGRCPRVWLDEAAKQAVRATGGAGFGTLVGVPFSLISHFLFPHPPMCQCARMPCHAMPCHRSPFIPPPRRGRFDLLPARRLGAGPSRGDKTAALTERHARRRLCFFALGLGVALVACCCAWCLVLCACRLAMWCDDVCPWSM